MGVIARGSLAILQARKQGKRPADMILVSLVGPLPNELNPVVEVAPETGYDWTWARGLRVCFWVSPTQYSGRPIIDCAAMRPSHIHVWDWTREQGFDVAVLPSVDSIERVPHLWDMRVVADRWLPFQEEHFARSNHAAYSR